MTIAVAVAIPEGIVLAAESRQTYSRKVGDVINLRIGTDFGKKVFQLGSKVGAVTWGWAFLLGRNINSYVEEFKSTINQKGISEVEQISHELAKFLTDKYMEHIAKKLDNPAPRAIGFYIGGYDSKGGNIYATYIPEKDVSLVSNTIAKSGMNWGGQIDVITRLLKGYDHRIVTLPGFPKDLTAELNKLEYVTNFNNMTLQDAVDYAVFLVKTTIDMQRFSDGIVMQPGDIPGCGGSIDVAVVQPDSNFCWIQRKELRGERTTE